MSVVQYDKCQGLRTVIYAYCFLNEKKIQCHTLCALKLSTVTVEIILAHIYERASRAPPPHAMM